MTRPTLYRDERLPRVRVALPVLASVGVPFALAVLAGWLLDVPVMVVGLALLVFGIGFVAGAMVTWAVNRDGRV